MNNYNGQKFREYLLECISGDGLIQTATDKDKLLYLKERFHSEYGFMVERVGEQKAMAKWLSGLAIDIDYMNYKIIEIGKSVGMDLSTESKEYNYISNWFLYSANQYLRMIRRAKADYKIINPVK
jgi:hypothetical protein